MEKLQTKKTIAILLSGRAGVGKTTTANLLVDYLEGRYDRVKVGIFPFANRLKTLAMMMGWDGVKDARGRQFLQRLGQVAREYDKDVWAKGALSCIEESNHYPYSVVLFDDWRFPNEVDVINNNPLYSSFKVRVYAPNREILRGSATYNEESEISLPDETTGCLYYNATIDNHSTLDTLMYNVSNLWEHILIQKQELIK